MTSYIFMDESGDLGFDYSKPKTSKFFVVSFLFVKNKKTIEKIVKKIFAGFTKTELRHHAGMLHAYKEKPKTRIKLLQLLNDKEITIMLIFLNKKKVYTKLQDEKQVLYNYVTNILLDRICTKRLLPKNEEILLNASRRETNKFINQNFCSYIEGQTQINHKLKIKVVIRTPYAEKCLQVGDFVSWATFRKHEYGDGSYLDIIKEKIVEENALLT